jgi:hypothetical protein
MSSLRKQGSDRFLIKSGMTKKGFLGFLILTPLEIISQRPKKINPSILDWAVFDTLISILRCFPAFCPGSFFPAKALGTF